MIGHIYFDKSVVVAGGLHPCISFEECSHGGEGRQIRRVLKSRRSHPRESRITRVTAVGRRLPDSDAYNILGDVIVNDCGC